MSFQDKALKLVFEYVKKNLEKTDTHVTFGNDEVYIVWSSFVLKNWKCLISTTLPDGMYYEVTYNADKSETYIDAYKKFENVKIPDTYPEVGKEIFAHSKNCSRVFGHAHGSYCAEDCPTCGGKSDYR